MEKAMASTITSPIVDTTVGDTLMLKIFINSSLAGLASLAPFEGRLQIYNAGFRCG
jgi:hypothetical protein